MSRSRPRVIIVADNASARFGGEAILPLHYFRFLRARGIEAHLLVHDRTRDELLAVIEPADHPRLHFVPDLAAHRLLWAIGRRLPHRLGIMFTGTPMHLLTQVQQRRLARRLVRDHALTIVHEPIPVSPKTPSLMHGIGVPVVIGPMNGGMTYPAGFRYLESSLERLLIGLGRAASGLANALIPGKRRAAALLVANQRTARALPAGIRAPVIELVENGADLSLWQAPELRSQPDGVTRLLYMGRMVDWKAIDLLLHALARLVRQPDAPRVHIDLLGDGDQRHALESLSRELGIGQHLSFHGFLPQAECALRLAACDALVLPSLYECGGAVVLEAMAMSKPVIATDWGGPADYLDPTCGILVPPTDRETFISDLARAISELARDPDRRVTLGHAGRVKVETHYDWQVKIDRILEIYQQVIHRDQEPHS
ncbi:glycosyltransferase family 4 protein [Mucisphaera sp.]|uniref:glycosyltransferase family 4 protein n=1 Tax=Mucisphaera sp. TaxID=2913024 RepID=UPI003D09E1F8